MTLLDADAYQAVADKYNDEAKERAEAEAQEALKALAPIVSAEALAGRYSTTVGAEVMSDLTIAHLFKKNFQVVPGTPSVLSGAKRFVISWAKPPNMDEAKLYR